MTTAVRIIAGTAALGFLLNIAVFFFVLSRGKKLHHYLFACILLICALWDLGILVSMLRNDFSQELILVGLLTSISCVFLLPLIFHFTCSYLERPMVKTSLLLWIIAAEVALLMSVGKFGRITGVYTYSWGSFWRGDNDWHGITLIGMLFFVAVLLTCCGMLAARLRRGASSQDRQQLLAILVGFLALALATVRMLPLLGIDLPYLMPAGILINDIFVVLIGVSIINHQITNHSRQR